MELIALARDQGTEGLSNEVLRRAQTRVRQELAKAADKELDELGARHKRVAELMQRIVR